MLRSAGQWVVLYNNTRYLQTQHKYNKEIIKERCQSSTALQSFLPFLIFSVRGRPPRNPRVSVRQGPGPTELFIFIIERERESSTNQGGNWNRNHRLECWTCLSAVLTNHWSQAGLSCGSAPLSVLQSVTVQPVLSPGVRPATDGARSPQVRAASINQWEGGELWGLGFYVMESRLGQDDWSFTLSREIIINYDISLSPASQAPGWETNIQSWPASSELSLFHSEGQLVGSRFCGRNFKMFELSGWRKISRLWLEGGDGSVWMGKDLCLLKLKCFIAAAGVQDLPHNRKWNQNQFALHPDKVALIEFILVVYLFYLFYSL